jgi:GR25 family glycosyltransferase involved in LPS biosynthesis
MLSSKIISVDLENFKNISLSRDITERLEIYEKRRTIQENNAKNLSNEFIKFEVINGVTPKDFVLDNGNIIYKNKTLRTEFITELHAANILSHYNIWTLCDEDTLVFEDDITLTASKLNNLLTVIDEFNKHNIKDAILYLQLNVPYPPYKEKSINIQQMLSDKLAIVGEMDFSGTAAYYITSNTKKTILNALANDVQPLCACDKFLHTLIRKGVINYCMPTARECLFDVYFI